jgi:hypothetical protein
MKAFLMLAIKNLKINTVIHPGGIHIHKKHTQIDDMIQVYLKYKFYYLFNKRTHQSQIFTSV